jgi:hypothetical protein
MTVKTIAVSAGGSGLIVCYEIWNDLMVLVLMCNLVRRIKFKL